MYTVMRSTSNSPTARTAETARAVRERARTAERRKTLKRRARVREKARTATRRELPNSADCPTTRTAQEREVPNGDNGADIEGRELPKSAYCRTAQGNSGDAPFVVAVVVAVWHLALLGSSRLTAVCALRQFAPLGQLAPFSRHRARRFSVLRRLCTAPFRAPRAPFQQLRSLGCVLSPYAGQRWPAGGLREIPAQLVHELHDPFHLLVVDAVGRVTR